MASDTSQTRTPVVKKVTKVLVRLALLAGIWLIVYSIVSEPSRFFIFGANSNPFFLIGAALLIFSWMIS